MDNTVLSNASGQLLTLRNNETGSGKTMNIALAGSSNVIQITGAGGITIESNISGSGGITKQGAGTGNLTLSGNNSYSGITAINTGTFFISHSNALGAFSGTSNHTTISSDGTSNSPRLSISGSNINSPENITLIGRSEQGNFRAAIQNASGTNTLSGNIILAGTGGNKIQATAGTLNLTGNISQTTTTHGLTLQTEGSALLNVSNGLAINGAPLLLVGVNGASTGIITLSGTGNTGTTTLASKAHLRLGITNALPHQPECAFWIRRQRGWRG